METFYCPAMTGKGSRCSAVVLEEGVKCGIHRDKTVDLPETQYTLMREAFSLEETRVPNLPPLSNYSEAKELVKHIITKAPRGKPGLLYIYNHHDDLYYQFVFGIKDDMLYFKIGLSQEMGEIRALKQQGAKVLSQQNVPNAWWFEKFFHLILSGARVRRRHYAGLFWISTWFYEHRKRPLKRGRIVRDFYIKGYIKDQHHYLREHDNITDGIHDIIMNNKHEAPSFGNYPASQIEWFYLKKDEGLDLFKDILRFAVHCWIKYQDPSYGR